VSHRQTRTDSPPKAESPPSHARDRTGYAWCSTRPLHILVFLLPLIIVYEIGSVIGARTGALESIRAERLLRDFFEAVGVAGLHLPALAIVAVLLSWQIISRDRWRIRLSTIVLMGFESLAWTLPILVLNNVIGGSLLGGGDSGGGMASAALTAGAEFSGLSWPQLVSIAIGAGLYEELLFRMVLIAMVHLVTHDLLRFRDYPSRVVAVVVSAAVFALYHEAAMQDPKLLAFYFAAGVLFGSVYLWRGFGIVVGAHAAYDLIALLL
jgi:membrane protease YdiL (CAAX protease family)